MKCQTHILATLLTLTLYTTPALSETTGMVTGTKSGPLCNKFGVGNTRFAIDPTSANAQGRWELVLNRLALAQPVTVNSPQEEGFDTAPANVVCGYTAGNPGVSLPNAFVIE